MSERRLSGLYLVVDPSMATGPAALAELVGRVERALEGGVDLVQLWAGPEEPATDPGPAGQTGAVSQPDTAAVQAPWRAHVPELARELRRVTRAVGVPLLIGEDVELAAAVGADGAHLEGAEPAPAEVRRRLLGPAAGGGRPLVGYTCGNDLDKVRWAEAAGADYVSFCALFPSPSAVSCEIVPLHTVAAARQLAPELPLFASGGITLQNAGTVLEAGADGVAVISAVLRAADPAEAARRFQAVIALARRARDAGRSGTATAFG